MQYHNSSKRWLHTKSIKSTKFKIEIGHSTYELTKQIHYSFYQWYERLLRFALRYVQKEKCAIQPIGNSSWGCWSGGLQSIDQQYQHLIWYWIHIANQKDKFK